MEEITEIILKNESLIYSIANKFSKYKSKEDLFQAGCIGIIEAYKNYDKTKGVKFTSYAYKYIYGEISKFVREDRSIKLSKDLNKLKNKIEIAKEHLTQHLMRIPTNKELSDFLEIDLSSVEQILNYKDPFSMDEIIADDISMHELIKSANPDYNTLIALKTEIEKLKEPERTIMIERYFEDLTQSEIANNLGLSQVDVSRKEKKVLTKLKHTFNWQQNPIIL